MAPLSGDSASGAGGAGGGLEGEEEAGALLSGHTRPVSALAAAADAERLVSVGEDGLVKARWLSWGGGGAAPAPARRGVV